MHISSSFGGGQCGILVRCLRRTFVFFFVSHLLVIVGNGQEIQPSRLTQMKMDHRPLSLNYGRMDQCMLGPGQQKIGSYGLLFRYPKGYLCPNEGLLICYPSQLDGHKTSHGIRVARPFQVANREDSEIARQCQAQLCHHEPAHCANDWHGIRVYTAVNMSTILELSITNRSYVLGDVDRFWLALGKMDNLTTVVHVLERGKEKHRIRHPDRMLRQAYFDHVGQGAFLGNYPGLWMLGVDILPMEPDEKMLFYVNRSCQCAIEAWLTHPTDEEELPEKIPLEAGSNECDNDNIKNVEVKHEIGSLETNDKVTILIFGQKWTDSVDVELNCTAERKIDIQIKEFEIEYHPNIRWEKEGPLKVPASADDDPNSSGLLLLKNVELHVEIHKHKYFYEFFFYQGKEEKLGNSYFPDVPRKKLDNCLIQVNGNAVVGRIEKAKMDKMHSHKIALPYTKKLNEEFTMGTVVRIRGVVKENADYLEINLMHDAPDWNAFIGATVFQLLVNFVNKTIEMATHNSEDNWHNEREVENAFPFRRGEIFKCEILVFEDKPAASDDFFNNEIKAIYKIVVNDKEVAEYDGDLPIDSGNKDQLELLLEPQILFGALDKGRQSDIVVKHELEHLFSVGEYLCLEGVVGIHDKHELWFSVNLFHEANEYDKKIGDTLLKLNFTFNSDGSANKLVMEECLHKQKGECIGQNMSNPIGQAGQSFKVTIKAGKDYYEMSVNDGVPFNFTGSTEDEFKIPPSWAVNWLTVQGDVKNVKIGRESKRCGLVDGQKPLPNYIKQVDPQKPLKVGDVIIVKGTIKKKDDINSTDPDASGLHISVNLLYEALDYHDSIGQTVLWALFYEDIVEFNSYYNETWKYTEEGIGALNINNQIHNLTKPLVEGQQFQMKVKMGKENFEIQIGEDKFEYPQWLPCWAIQYIVVEYDLEAPNNGEPFIQVQIA